MKNLIESFEKLDKFVIVIINFPLILILGLIDYQTGVEFDFSIFYLIPISMISWYANKSSGLYAAIISEIIWFIADMLGGHLYSSTLILLGNSAIRLCLFVTIALLLSNFKQKIQKHYQTELLLQKNKNIIEASQRLTALIAENIIQQNAEILMWINKKKNKRETVSKTVDKASQIIGLSMKLLSESSFVEPYRKDFPVDSDKYLELIKEKLSQINRNVSLDIEPQLTEDNK
ncbi:hypothetical protein JW935_07240 [candidate division KSB1 bacterium]|nr:hypothetical protein [candidate division KSB1 bacterium]